NAIRVDDYHPLMHLCVDKYQPIEVPPTAPCGCARSLCAVRRNTTRHEQGLDSAARSPPSGLLYALTRSVARRVTSPRVFRPSIDCPNEFVLSGLSSQTLLIRDTLVLKQIILRQSNEPDSRNSS